MKALTVWQPWASLIALDLKKYETRSWPTNYRGNIVIHAAKTDDGWFYLSPHERYEIVLSLKEHGIEDVDLIPRSAGVCVAYLADCLPVMMVPPEERKFGDFTPGRFCWLLTDIRPFAEPIPARGQQGLWDWPEGLR